MHAYVRPVNAQHREPLRRRARDLDLDLNLSIGGGDTFDLDPLEQAVNSLSARTGTLFVVSAGNSTGTATLTGGGRVLAEAGLANCSIWKPETCELRAQLPAEAASYTLSASMRRQVPYSALSTGVDAVWTFRSSRTATEQPLPLMAMRYVPAGLDAFNRARPGSLTRLPLWVERNPGAVQGVVKTVRLEMSSDDGASWRRIPAVRTASGWTAVVPNPRTPGFVSLRVTVTDTSGTALTQTVTRAYAVG